MLRYGAWLKKEARTGRFHYLTADVVTAKLAAAGFAGIEHRLSYVDQAYIFRAVQAGLGERGRVSAVGPRTHGR